MVNEREAASGETKSASSATSRRKVKLQILLGFLILLSGVIIGAGGTVILLRGRIIWRSPHRPKTTAEGIAKRIGDSYELSESQVRQVEAIVAKRLQAKQAMRQEMDERSASADDELLVEMRYVLSAEQFESWAREFRARRDRHRKHKGRTHGS